MSDKIDIQIDAKVLYQMFEYAAFASHIHGTEIAGWGHYSKKDGIYKLAPLLKQEVKGAEVDTFPDEIIHRQDYDISDMVVQWHSHVNFPVFASNTDKELIRKALKLFPYLISIIVNCKHEYFAELNYKHAGGVELDTPLNMEVNLIPYYDNTAVYNEVKKKCYEPKEVVEKVTAVEGANHKKGWHPRYGSGTWYGKNFYPHNGKFWVKNVNYNPLLKIFNGKGEIVIPFKDDVKDSPDKNVGFTAEETLDMFEDYSGFGMNEYGMGDYIPPIKEVKMIKQVKEKAILLDKDLHDKVSMVVANGTYWIQHLKDNSYCEISEDGVLVNGHDGTWNEFLIKIGHYEEPYMIDDRKEDAVQKKS